jgi:hypothetical protein
MSVLGGFLDFSTIKIIPLLAVFLPLGAVFFGMFLISYMMEKEMAKFDEENAPQYARIQPDSSGDSNCRSCKNCECQSRKQTETKAGEVHAT